MRWLVLCVVGVACGRGGGASSSGGHSAVLTRVGDRPRGYADLDLRQKSIVGLLRGEPFDPKLEVLRTRCGLDLAKIERVRIAIGEPLRVAAEVDGAIDARATKDGAPDWDRIGAPVD